MPTQYGTDYELLTSPTGISIGMGYGTYRYYLNDSFPLFNKETYNSTAATKSIRAFAVQFLSNSIVSTINDNPNTSTNSVNVFSQLAIPAGTVIFGDFSIVRLISGAAVVFLV